MSEGWSILLWCILCHRQPLVVVGAKHVESLETGAAHCDAKKNQLIEFEVLHKERSPTTFSLRR